MDNTKFCFSTDRVLNYEHKREIANKGVKVDRVPDDFKTSYNNSVSKDRFKRYN